MSSPCVRQGSGDLETMTLLMSSATCHSTKASSFSTWRSLLFWCLQEVLRCGNIWSGWRMMTMTFVIRTHGTAIMNTKTYFIMWPDFTFDNKEKVFFLADLCYCHGKQPYSHSSQNQGKAIAWSKNSTFVPIDFIHLPACQQYLLFANHLDPRCSKLRWSVKGERRVRVARHFNYYTFSWATDNVTVRWDDGVTWHICDVMSDDVGVSLPEQTLSMESRRAVNTVKTINKFLRSIYL